jgi:hypothetical protein
MSNVVDLKLASLASDMSFISDLCRYAEKILTESQVRKKYHLLDEAAWERLGEDEGLLEKVEEEKLKRMRDGSSKREKAQLHIMKAPDVLADILLNTNIPARSRIDSAKTLDSLAANGPANTPAAADRFHIVINLGADVDGKPIIESYNKSIKPDVNDIDPNACPLPQQGISINTDPPQPAAITAPVTKTPEEISFDNLMLYEG